MTRIGTLSNRDGLISAGKARRNGVISAITGGVLGAAAVALSLVLLSVFQPTKRSFSELPLNNLSAQNNSLSAIITSNNLEPLALNVPTDEAKIALGQALFFDKELSGNRDISCATCHHPLTHSGDGMSLPHGAGGEGIGRSRTLREGSDLIPRNAPEVFNRGASEWETMFWDGRVATKPYEKGEFHSPAADKLPEGLDSPLAAQAMFPVTSRHEMRGEEGDIGRTGLPNELGNIKDGNNPDIWSALMVRLTAIPEYVAMFNEVYPDVPTEELGFEHAANALAAFEIFAFSYNDSPWDLYLAGDDMSLSEAAMEGADLFFGKADCASCHSGTLFTDQQFHNIGIPAFGPGKGGDIDQGRFLETDDPADKFAFRTPPLRNVQLTGPYMHNGAYIDLESAVRHHFDAENMLRNFDSSDLHSFVQAEYEDSDAIEDRIAETLSPYAENPPELTDNEVSYLVAFLHSLTSPSATDLGHLVPESVPSGLPVSD